MKLQVAQGNERGVQEAAKLIQAYCELVMDKEGVATEKAKMLPEKKVLPTTSVTTSTSHINSTKDEGSLLDF
ncbi:hypothetical protein [Alkalihalobacterium elongatum]|uniref:hypothetical protein n=1 Tax=Alkalihalobacterium elongatum TaxID=2675466 RepID=UPI001F47D406|nr:hypothetical protein [Alkalihalobacterium elongatum]